MGCHFPIALPPLPSFGSSARASGGGGGGRPHTKPLGEHSGRHLGWLPMAPWGSPPSTSDATALPSATSTSSSALALRLGLTAEAPGDLKGTSGTALVPRGIVPDPLTLAEPALERDVSPHSADVGREAAKPRQSAFQALRVSSFDRKKAESAERIMLSSY